MVNQQSSSVHNKAYVEMCFGGLVVYTMKLIKMYLRSLVCIQNKDYVEMYLRSLVCVPNKDYVEMSSLVFVNNKVHLVMCFRGVVGL